MPGRYHSLVAGGLQVLEELLNLDSKISLPGLQDLRSCGRCQEEEQTPE